MQIWPQATEQTLNYFLESKHEAKKKKPFYSLSDAFNLYFWAEHHTIRLQQQHWQGFIDSDWTSSLKACYSLVLFFYFSTIGFRRLTETQRNSGSVTAVGLKVNLSHQWFWRLNCLCEAEVVQVSGRDAGPQPPGDIFKSDSAAHQYVWVWFFPHNAVPFKVMSGPFLTVFRPFDIVLVAKIKMHISISQIILSGCNTHSLIWGF